MQEQYQKQVYQEKIRAYLKELRARLDAIEAELEQSSDTELEDRTAAKTLEQAKTVGDAARDHLKSVEETESVNWEARRARLEAAWDDLQSKLDYLAKQIDKPDDTEGSA